MRGNVELAAPTDHVDQTDKIEQQEDKKDKKAKKDKAKKDKKDKSDSAEEGKAKKKKKDKDKDKDKDKKKDKKQKDKKVAAEGMAASSSKLEAAMEKQSAAQAKKAMIAASTPPGAVIPYVDPNGGVYQQCAKPAQRKQEVLPVPSFPSMVHVCLAFPKMDLLQSGALNAAGFKLDTFEKSNVVIFPDIPQHLYSAQCLKAMLFGKAIADIGWIRSRMESGRCLQYSSALNCHLYVYLSEQFCATHAEHAAALKMAVADFRIGSKQKRLHVFEGEMPGKLEHPKLSLAAVSPQEYAAQKSRNVVDLKGLLLRLSSITAEQTS